MNSTNNDLRRMRSLLLIGCLGAPLSALSHHSPAAFDQTAFTVIEGTVVEFSWGNPHVYLAVATEGPDGNRYVQEVEAGPASQLLSRGVTIDLLRPGDRVTVRANPSRRGPGNIVLGVELTTADGSRFPLHARSLRALDSDGAVATSIEGTWVPRPEGYLGLAAAMRDWPLTDLANEARADTNAPTNQVACIPPGPPALMTESAPIAIGIDGDTVTIDIDGVKQRIVQIGSERPPDIEATLFGHSIGYWDGATLVIDTLAYSAHPEGMGFRLPSSDAKHTVERLSLGDDGRRLDYEITVTDPAYLLAPQTYRTNWDYRPDEKPSNAACDPDVARRFLAE